MSVQPLTFLRTIDLSPRRRRRPTLISIFSGCGGAALGICMAGFEVRVFVENDRNCCQTLAMNWRAQSTVARNQRQCWHQRRAPVILAQDITQTTTAEILRAAELEVGEADLLEGGFPCQGFSLSGKRVIDDPRNALYRECVRVIGEALPKLFVLENVPGLVSMANGAIMVQICNDLAGVGYDVQWDILNAADYGVPQNRKRIFWIGRRVDAMELPANGRPRLYMGCAAGVVSHPEWFLKRLDRPPRPPRLRKKKR